MNDVIKTYDYNLRKWVIGYWVNNTAFKILALVD